MPIQFPPINPGDTLPIDGETYTYVPTQTEYIYNQTENSWSILAESGEAVPVIGVLQAGEGVTLDPSNGDLSQGNVQISSTGAGGGFWQRSNGVLSPTTAGDDLALQDNAGSAFLIDRFTNIDDI